MLSKSLLRTLFGAFSIRRWNDQIRPFELVEMDKHAHKMAIAYCLARYEEPATHVDWSSLIRGGVFELLRRAVLSDIKAPVYRKIHSQDPETARRLGSWVFTQLEPQIDDARFKTELKEYLQGADVIEANAKKILTAAHVFASYWEFQIIKAVSPSSEQLAKLDVAVRRDLEEHLSLTGIQKLVSAHKILRFIDLIGQLRFQKRWAQTPRIPDTSVLGHSMLVATIAYMFSRQISACESRTKNNFFAALFHDLPEALTRDIISPIKTAIPELTDAIARIEAELVDQEMSPYLEKDWLDDFYYLTRDEFKSKIRTNGNVQAVSSDEINSQYNNNAFDPVDGELVKTAVNPRTRPAGNLIFLPTLV